MLGLAAILILQQALVPPAQRPSGSAPALPTAPTQAWAVRADRAPAIDGRDDDPVWRLAPAIGPFLEWQPSEGKPSRFRTEAKVAYDAANLYVFIRAYDPHPDSIIRRLDRRDTFGPSDRVGFMVDAYHDRRSGFEFWVNASGVKVDVAIFDDKEDQAWDAVWDVATRIDSLGWTAEFRVPLSQLRYPVRRSYTFGLLLMRDIYRYSERTAWPQLSQAKAGMVMQFGEVTGIEGLEAPRRLEASPYMLAKDASVITDNAFDRASHATLGGDLKYRVASNLTLDATVNPDFGEVEADPAVLNLSAYESFFTELRPFFVAGRGVFRFDVDCNDVNCASEGLYYSRRIGRTPQLAGTFGDTTPAQPTTILGAAKLTGRLPGGLAIGFLDAVTAHDQERFGDTLKTTEPATNFAVLRLKQDLRNGASSIGGMLTAVNRSLDATSAPYLDRSAYAGAVDFRHRFPKDVYEMSGSFDVSRVEGTPAAILGIQTDGVHYYQRPDGGLPLDSTRTVLTGDAEEFKFDKVGGAHTSFETAYQRRSAGFEINDLGYLQRADQQSWSTWVGLFDRRVTRLYQQLQWNWNWWQNWSTGGLPQERAVNTNLHVTLRDSWGIAVGGTVGQLGITYDDRAARGGPAMRQNPYFVPWLSIGGDDRRSVVPYLNIQTAYADAGHTHTFHFTPELDWRVASRFGSALVFQYVRNVNDIQWYGNFTDSAGVTHYTFAHLPQTTVSLTLRLNYTFTPSASLQVYAQPFVSKGTYADVRELSATPRAAAYEDRYQAYGDTAVTSHPGGFDFKEFQSNVVFRWEYRPGSTLFLVWSEGRRGETGAEGTNDFQGDVRDLFRLHPMNTLLVKMSYWLNP